MTYKKLYIAEKPSVARQFAEVLGVKNSKDGYMESEDAVVTWCVGHLVTMSYPEEYDASLKKWSYDTLPFIPEDYRYEVIPQVKKQFGIVKKLLTREDVDTIYVCTDSGREGEYIYRLVDRMAGVGDKKEKRRVWIDSQTEEEIKRGIREAKPLSEYDALSDAAYLRAQEDYLMGINFSRALSLKYAYGIKDYLGLPKCVIAVGRVMTCVLGIVVEREREIRAFQSTPFFRILAECEVPMEAGAKSAGSASGEAAGSAVVGAAPKDGGNESAAGRLVAEWHLTEKSHAYGTPGLYKENGFLKKTGAESMIDHLSQPEPVELVCESIFGKTEKKNPPMLYNLAELQNDCSRLFKIDPGKTLEIVQELYEKKLVTYPRTDARVLSTAAAKEIHKNLSGLAKYGPLARDAAYVVEKGGYKGLTKSKYVNDKLITDHYAIVPTGVVPGGNLGELQMKIYDRIARRFLSIFYPAAEYKKYSAEFSRKDEMFSATARALVKPGYLRIMDPGIMEKLEAEKQAAGGTAGDTNVNDGSGVQDPSGEGDEGGALQNSVEVMSRIKKGSRLQVNAFRIREGKTNPPKRYTSGTLIITMENAGQFIENEELREEIKGSGIGTSATRGAILDKLFKNKYLSLNAKTQVVTPTQIGEMIYDAVAHSIRGLLRADLTASWEKGLSGVADGSITKEEYLEKMNAFVRKNTEAVKALRNQNEMRALYDRTAQYYKKPAKKKKASE